MRYAALFLVMLVGFLFSACAGSGQSGHVNERGERVYIDDATLESFDDDLRRLTIAIHNADADAEHAMRVKLGETARLYQKALLSAAYDTSSTPRRALASILLGFTGDPAVIPVMVEKAGSHREAESVRLNAMLGLSVMGDKLRDYPEHDALIRVLIAAMEDTRASFSMRRAAINAYAVAFDGVRGNSVTPLVNRFLVDPDPRVQIAAINAIGQIGDLAAVSELTAVGIGHPAPEIRAASAIALGKIPDPQRAIPALERACRDSNVRVRRDGVDAISRHYGSDPERIYSIVVSGLADFDERVREAAALALARIRDDRAVEPLLQATGDRTAIVREAAVRSLGTLIGQEREKEAYPLVELLTDGHPGVQVATVESLARITRKDFGADQHRWRAYFYVTYPELDPANMYGDGPRPRMSAGLGSTGGRPSQARPPRQPPRPPRQPPRPR